MSIDDIKIGKRELRIMTLACNGTAETSAEATVESLKAKGLIEVEDSWLLTRGLTGGRAGAWNYCFHLTESGRSILDKMANR